MRPDLNIVVFAPGCLARLIHGDPAVQHDSIVVTVLAVMLKASGGDGPTCVYEVSWLHAGDRKQAWVDAAELEPIKTGERLARIGFRKDAKR